MRERLREKIREAVLALSEKSDSDVILYAGPLDKPFDDQVLDACQLPQKKKNVLLLLATLGGDANVAYRIARHLQRCYEQFSVYIHTMCKSAGTLLASGANEIIMSDYAEMGPLDVQLQKEDEIGVRTSGLTIFQALGKLESQAYNMFERYFLDLRFGSGGQITTKSALDIAADLTVGLMNPIYSQIDPMRLGETERAIRIALEYGERIGKYNLKEGTLARLVMKYPDHSFVIDRAEAEELFKNVRRPTELEFRLAALLQPVVDDALYKTTIVENLNMAGGSHVPEKESGSDSARGGSQVCSDQQGDVKTSAQGDNGADEEVSSGKPPQVIRQAIAKK